VPLLVPACRTNLMMQQLAALFGISGSAVHRGTDRTAPRLAAPPGPPPAGRREPRIADGTLIPVHDKNRTAKSKNDRRGVHPQIVVRARDRCIVAAGEAWSGNRNDTMVHRETLGRTLPGHPRLTATAATAETRTSHHPAAAPTDALAKTGTTAGSANAGPAPGTRSPASKTTRSCAKAAAAAPQSTMRSPASPRCTI
jgi:hypothetical protein